MSLEHDEKSAEDLSLEIALLREELKELKDSVAEVVELFRDGKSVIKLMALTGTIAKWFAITAASLTTFWLTITNWPKH